MKRDGEEEEQEGRRKQRHFLSFCREGVKGSSIVVKPRDPRGEILGGVDSSTYHTSIISRQVRTADR